MPYWLATQRTVQQSGFVSRFDPHFWTVDFPRPMMAAVTATAPDALRVDAVFYRANDLAGLIWWSADTIDHPLLRYETARDYRRCRLSFRWRSSSLLPLDAINGPTLTIEGRDAAGNPKSWFVRLWNYAEGSPEDAQVTLDFGALDGGFTLPGEADPVWAGDIDRMFVSLVAPGYSGEDTALAAPAEGWVELSGIACGGSGGVLAIGDVVVPEHGLGIASGYDDSYSITPARLLHNLLRLGYRGSLVHYVGMSHYFRLEASGDGLYASLAGGVLNIACAAWHRDLAVRAKALGIGIVWSLSYELFDAHCWGDWKQRTSDGAPALTGWTPPSTLLSPAHDGAMGYLRAVAGVFMAIAAEAGLAPQFQAGEPWWWVMPDGRPCLYDDAARLALGGPAIADARGPQPPEALALMDRAGTLLAASTAALMAAVRSIAPEVRTHLLVYLPSLLADDAPGIRRMNLPVGWARPAFDVLQVEDYDWVTAGDTARSARGLATVADRLGYPPGARDYLAGFVLRPEDAGQWAAIDAAADAARRRGTGRTFLWALPQVMRDGLVHFDMAGEDSDVTPFDDVLFPLALGKAAEVTPQFSTAIVASAGGREARNAGWSQARTGYDVGPGIRSESDIAALLDFFRARMGPARGFRLRDPFDSSSAGGEAPSGPGDQMIGTGDGTAVRFALGKVYGEGVRRITRPVTGSVRVAVAGVETAGFSVEAGGWVVLDAAPPVGARVTAGFRFDVAVRFAEDRLSVSRTTFQAGEAASVPLVELRED